jgi:phosphohistidine phosphatase
MQLYFLRHGLADRSAWGGDDFSRPLTPEGVEKMERSAKTIEAAGLRFDRILSSPLVRAMQTAEIVAKRQGIQVEPDDRLAGGFGLAALREILESCREDARVLLVGHEPTFSDTIGGLIGGADVVCKKGSLARVDLYSTSPPRGELVWMIPPRVLAL